MSKEINKNKVVVFTGAGVSAESGILTFRDSGGLWNTHKVTEVATPQEWRTNPSLVLDFYNERRRQLKEVEPNAAHCAIAKLEERYEVVVITQNVDDLHERVGSSNVIHLHGEITKARSTVDPKLVYEIGISDVNLGMLCEKDSQLRPHIVWFHENVFDEQLARNHFKDAGRILVVGTSLVVQPAASMIKRARHGAEKIFVNFDIERVLYGYKCFSAKATEMVPVIVEKWLSGIKVV